jgi:hypothetical protein
MLEDEGYDEFCQYLLKEQGLLKDTNWKLCAHHKIENPNMWWVTGCYSNQYK